MIGLTARPALTNVQQQVSEAVAESLPELPLELTDVIAQMTAGDFSLATHPLQVDEMGVIIDSKANRDIWASIKEALITTQCDRAVIRTIFQNLGGVNGPNNRARINAMFNEIRTAGFRINIDCSDMTDLILDGYDLSSMSAIGVTFYRTLISGCTLTDADFSDSIFTRSLVADISNVTITRAQLIESDFRYYSHQMINAQGVFSEDSIFREIGTKKSICSDGTWTDWLVVRR